MTEPRWIDKRALLLLHDEDLAEHGEVFIVQQQERALVDPARLGHLASALNVSRNSRMNSRPSAICSTIASSNAATRYPSGASVKNSASPCSTFRRANISFGSTTPSELPI